MGAFFSLFKGFSGNQSAKSAPPARKPSRHRGQLAIERLESRINPSFSNLTTVAQSLRQAENALPQVPGLDTSIGAMLPSRLSDVVGLNAYGSGASTWAGFDQQYPNPTVENLVSIANTVTAGLPTPSPTTTLISGFGNNGTGWTINNGWPGGQTSSISNNTLLFTNGTVAEYNSIWYNSPILNLKNSNWTAEFTLTNIGAQSQDGGSFMLQTAGTAAVGNYWYGSGITNGLSFSWNNYNTGNNGTQFAVTTGGGTPVFTYNQKAINMSNSSNPVSVVLQYNSFTENLTATVSQLGGSPATVQTWQQTYNVGNLSALQSGAYVGFVGGNGEACSETTITDFSFSCNNPIAATILPTNSGTPTTTNALTSSATAPIYGNLPDLQLGQYTKGFTVQAWFNSSNIGDSWQRIIDLGNGAEDDNIVVGVTSYNNGTPQLFMSTWNGSNWFNFYTGSTLSSNTWYHVTAVFGGGSSGYGAIYLNGVLQGSTSSLQPIPNVARTNNYWGRSNWSTDPVWQGQQDELRIWNYQLTAAEIAANYNVALVGPLPSGLIAYYNANETSGSTWHDITGNGNNATAMWNTAVATGQFTPGMLNAPAFTQTNTLPGQVYINYANAFTPTNPPASINTLGVTTGNQITPLLFQVGGTSTVPTYTLVATSSAITPSTKLANSTLNFGYSYTAGAQYVVGFIDQALSSSSKTLSTSFTLNNPSFEGPGIGLGNYQTPYQPTSNWAYNSSGLWSNGSALGFPQALDGQQGAWISGSGTMTNISTPYNSFESIDFTSGQIFNGTPSGSLAFAMAGALSSMSGTSANGVSVQLDVGPTFSWDFYPSKSTGWSYFATEPIDFNDPDNQQNLQFSFFGLINNQNALISLDDIAAGYVGTVPYFAGSAGTLSGWCETSTLLACPQIGAQFGPGATGFGYTTNDLGKVYAFGTVPTTTTSQVTLNPAEFAGTNSSLSVQNGVQIQWALGSSTSPLLYNSVFNTGGLDAGLHLTKSGNATLPVSVYGNLNLTLALNSANAVAIGMSGNWNASANLSNLNLAAGLGFLDSSISGGSYTVTATGAFNLVDTANNNANASGQLNSSGYLTLSSVAPASDFQVPSANSYSTSGSISVQASMPFVGEVGGQPFPTGSSAPTLSLASNTQNWKQGPVGTTTAYIQPQWTLQNFGNYLALAQLDAAALVNTGLNNAGGSLASLNQTNWQQVPFSTSTVGYNWGNGLNGTASLLYQNKLSIAGQTRMQGTLPLNNYGASFSITRASGTTPFNLSGNLTTDTPAVITASNLIAAPVAYHFSQILQANNTGLACREQPNHPGYLEFYATDPTITAFQMSPYNPATGSYTIGATTANAFAQLGFFGQPITSTAPQNPSFEGPLVPGTPNNAVYQPTTAQWSFSSPTSGIAGQGTWFTPSAPNGNQAAFMQGPGTITQQLQQVQGGLYQLSFFAATAPTYSANPFTVLVDGVQQFSVQATQINGTTWTQFTTSPFTLVQGNHTLTFNFTGNSSSATAVDAVQLFTNTLTARQATYPAALTLQGLLDVLNQPNLTNSGGSPVNPPAPLPGTNTATGQIYIDTATTYTASTLPTVAQFVANTVGNYITPLLFSVTGSGGSATYSLVAAGQPIQATRAGLQTASLVFTAFTPSATAPFVLGFTDQNISGNPATSQSVTAGTVGIDPVSQTGSWSVFPNGTLAPGSTNLAASTSVASNWLVAFSGVGGLAQAGQGSVARPNTDATTNYSYVYKGASYTTAFVPTKIRYYTNLTNSQLSSSPAPSITPILFTWVWNGINGSANYTVAAMGNPITPTQTGLNEANLLFPTLGSLTPGTNYLFGFRNSSTGVVSVQAGTGNWLYTTDTDIGINASPNFNAAGIYSLDIIASQTAGNPPTGSSSGTSAASTYGQVAINPNTTYTAAGNTMVLPTAMQFYATVPASGSGWITPLLFQQNGTGSTATFTLVAAGVSQQIANSGASQLPVAFPTALFSGLPTTGTFVMGYATQQVQLGNGGSIASVTSYSPGMVQYSTGGSASAWLTSAGGGSDSATGCPVLTVGSSVFTQGTSQSTSVLTTGNAYACTFLTDATQYQAYSALHSLQYNPAANNGNALQFSRADINNSAATVNISATGINTVSIPNVSNLNLTGSAVAQAAVSATRQFSLLLDANIVTNGATAANLQQQATATAQTTGVLTSVNTNPGNMPYGVDGFLSSIIQLTPGTQVYATAPQVSITDSAGYALNSSKTFPAWVSIPDLQLGQYAGPSIIGAPTLTSGGSGYNSAPKVTITDSNGGTGTGAAATAQLVGSVGGVTITNSGTGFTSAPTVTITDSNGGTGSGATAVATLGGPVTSLQVINGGLGYFDPFVSNYSPVVTITDSNGGTGSGATAVAIVNSSGVITGFTITNGGTGYTAPLVWISSPPAPDNVNLATASATVGVFSLANITITNPGKEYTNPVITLSGGGGSGATATASLVNGTVTGVTITNGGKAYTAPVATFSGGGGSGASAQFTSQDLLPPASGFTVQGWFNSNNLSTSSGIQTILDLGNGAASDNIIVGVNNNQLFMSTYNGPTASTCTGSTTLASNTWYHVSAVFGQGTAYLYLNGVLVGSSTSMQFLNNLPRSNNYWGQSNNSTNPAWQGQLDELRIWNAPLTAGQIQSNWNTPFATAQPNLIAYYKTDKTFAPGGTYAYGFSDADDSSGFGNKGLMTGTINGNFNNGLSINNGSVAIVRNGTATNYSSGSLTVSAPGVYYLTGTASPSAGSQPVSFLVTIDGVPVGSVAASLQGASGYAFVTAGLQLSPGTHTVNFQPQGTAAGSSSLTGLTLNFRPLVQSTVPLPLIGRGATAVANLNPNTGMLSSITVTNLGSGYANPVVTLSGNAPATASAVLGNGSSKGTITGIKLVNGGQYYSSAPTVSIQDSQGGTGTGATATATITNGVVTGITVTSSGSGYTRPVVTITAPVMALATREAILPVPTVGISDLPGGGSGAFASPLLNQNGTLSGIAIANNGATATANLASGTISSLNLTNPGQFYTAAPTVLISDSNGGSGSGATATATVVTGRIIAPPAITNPGSGYLLPPTVTITDPTGTGAVAFAVLDESLTVAGIVLANPGSGYTNPTFTLTPGFTGTATASYAGMSNFLSGQVTGLTVTSQGSGYTNPVVTIAPPATFNGGYLAPTFTLPFNSQFAASASATMGSNGTVAGIAVTTGGSGYSAPPTVTITGGGGSGATAAATVINGVVTGITVLNPGSGYTSLPTITLSSPNLQATATAVAGQITSISVPAGAGGSGYLSAPAVTIIDPNGTGATATAIITNGVVTGITVTNPGSGYVNPSIVIAPPSAPASGTIAGGIGGTTLLAAGSGYTSAPTVTITDAATNLNGPVSSAFPLGSSLDTYKGQIYINAQFSYTNTNAPVSFSFYSGNSTNYITPLLFTLSNGTYTLVASSAPVQVQSGLNSNVPLNFNYTLKSGTSYYMGFSDRNGLADTTDYAGSIEWSNASSNPANQWLFTSSGTYSNGIFVYGQTALNSTFKTGTNLSGGTRNYSFNVTSTNTSASASATISGGKVTGINISSQGTGYSNPVITISGGGGSGASGAALLALAANSVTNLSGGYGYATAPLVTVQDSGAGKGTGLTAKATINAAGVVTSITLSGSATAFSSYTAPVLVIAPPTGTTATATATVNSTVSAITLTAGGSGYTSAPTVTITDSNGGTGSGATAIATVVNNVVTGIVITNPGSGYANPIVTLSAPTGSIATAQPAQFSIQLTSPGQYYSQVPTITISGGGGSGATAMATLQNGLVTGITLTSAGTGYTSAPTISITNPVSATGVVTTGVMDGDLTYAGQQYLTTPTVTITDASGSGTGATGYAVLIGGQVADIVITNYGTGYVNPVITIAPPTVDISQSPNGPSAITHTFYFQDGNSWTTTTTSNSGISLQYQLIDQLTDLADMAANGLNSTNGTNTSPGLVSSANYYNLQSYLTPLLSTTAPTFAQAANLGMVMPEASNAPILWYMSAANPGDPFLTQALFANNQWNVATLGAVTMGNIDLVMNLAGNSGSPGFTGTAQIGYLDVNLQAEDFSPDIDFTLDTTPGQFFNFGTWQGILSTNGGLAQYATTTATINSYDLTLSAQVSTNVASLLALPTSGTVMPEVTFTASGGNGVYTGSFSDANWGPAEGLLYISQANIGAAFEQIAQALAYTDTSSYLGANLPFLGGNLQDLTGFSDYFVDYLQQELVGGAPLDLDSLIDWVNDNSSTFTLAFGTLTVGGNTGQGLYLTPVNWSDSVSVSTPISFNVATFAALAGGLPASQNMLANTVVPPANSGEMTVTADVAWQAPFGLFLSQTGNGTSLGYATQGYFSGSASTTAWNLSGISVQADDLDFQGTLGTLPIFFESDTSDTANVAVTNGQILTTLGANATASAVVTSTLTGSIASGGYSANLPVYYPTSTCYSGNFNISSSGGTSSGASLTAFLNQQALFTANLSGGAITGFNAITPGSNYLVAPQVIITDAAGQGSGASATASVNANGTIMLTLANAGSGYVSPVVTVVGGTFNFNNPTGTPSVTFTLPDIDNNDIAALSLANAIGNPDNMQSGLGALQAALQSVFTQSMAYTSQIIIGTGTSQFSQAFGIYGQIAGYLDQNLTPFVPTCDQNATASATINSAGAITAITVITTGESYLSTPAVTITDLAGTGSGATATANMVSDGNGGYYVGSITINSAGSGYGQPIVSIGSPSAGNQSADDQLYNEACTVFNLLLATPGLVLDPTQPQNPGSYTPNGQTASTSGQIPLFFDAYGNPLTYNSTAQYFINASGDETTVQAVQFPLIVDFTLQNTTIPFSLGMPGIPLTINNPADLNLLASGNAIVDLTFGIDALNGFYIVPTSGNQMSGTMNAGPDSDFSTTMTLGFLSGTMSASTGEIFSMPFSSTLTDPNFSSTNLNNQLTLAEINTLTPSSLFQTTLNIPTVGLNVDLQLQVAGGGIAAALPAIGNTMSITWTPGQGAPQLSYNNFYIDLGSFISDYMGAIAPQLTPITNGIQPILNALDTQIPILGDIIGGDTSLLGLANRFGGANLGFVQAVDAIVDMLSDVTSAVNYINANPGQSFIVPLDVVATFANDFRTAASGLSKPQQLNQLPSQAQVVSAMNNYMSRYANQVQANFTEPASRVVNQSYGVSGGLGISFDILDPVNIIGLITGQTVDLFHINFPSLFANFSIDESFPLDPPLYMTFGGGVNAGINLSLGMDSAGLEQWLAATVNGTQALSAAALEGLAQDILYQGFFVDGAGTDISANGYLSLGVQLNAGIAKAGVNGNFNIGMNMTPNVDSSGRLDLQEMIQLAGANFSSPQNLFDFDLTGSISANAYLDIFLPFQWTQVWNHNFGSITLFNVQNNPAPPTEQAASYGSLYLNMGPTAGRRSQTGKVTDEHFEIRHLAGVAGDESLSVQFYVAGVPQYLDAQGNPQPQVYHHVDKVVGIAGTGDDIIDCTGVLSPTHLEGGDGSDTLIGGQGLNYLDGGNGPDTLIGGPLADTILGGAGSDTINGGGGKDALDGGTGNDTIDHPVGGLVIPFSDRFGGDSLTRAAIAGSTLDFSRVTQNLKVTLGSISTIQIGNNNIVSWTGAGPAKIILGQGSDTVIFGPGYSSLALDTGPGRDLVEIQAFNPNVTVTINGPETGQTDQLLIQASTGQAVSADSSGIQANGAFFSVDWTEFRKLNIHQTASEVQLGFTAAAPQKVLVFGSEIDLTGTLNTTDVRLEAANLVSVQGNITTQPGGDIALVAGQNGKVQIGTQSNALLTATNGNIEVVAPIAYLGGTASKQAVSVTNGTFSNEAGKTIVTATAPTPFFNTSVPSITVGQGGSLRAWSTDGTALTAPLTPFQGYQGVPRFNSVSDLDGDGIADLVSVPQPGVSPHMVVFSGKDMSVLRSVYVFDPRFLGGVNVATGDVNGDGLADILLAADAGATPHVVVISGGTWEVLASFYAFDKAFHGGLRLTAADANGDGVLDIITSTASGPISHVVAFANLGQSVITSFYAFPEAVRNGVEIAAADLDGDNIAELILGTTGGTTNQVGIYRGNPSAIDYFMAYQGWNGDVRVGSVQTAGKTLITTGPGQGAGPNVRTFDPDTYDLLDSFFAGNPGDLSGITL
jgi:hypothetical protein